jgi:bifunctional pyridoxal-dependent enzyme with beta-cystathionase and maltose regulon repressor activities
MFSTEELRLIGELAKQYDALILADEVEISLAKPHTHTHNLGAEMLALACGVGVRDDYV